MSRCTCLVFLSLALLWHAVPVAAQAQPARGKYIVEQVSMCGDCHTPRNATGQLIADQALHGAPIGFRPMHAMPFAEQAPRLAGLPANYTAAQVATLLETGRKPDGSVPLPPMPPYRLSEADAQAVAEYIKSVK